MGKTPSKDLCNYDKSFVVSSYINYQRKRKKVIISKDLTNIITMYYSFNYNPKFDRQNHGEFLKFINDKHIAKVDRPDCWSEADRGLNICSTCIFDKCVTSEICNKFDVAFKLGTMKPIQPSQDSLPPFYIGYVTSIHDIKCWNYGLGEGKNRHSCLGIYINERPTMTVERGMSRDETKLKYPLHCQKTGCYYQNGDIFMLSFDFINDCIKIYHNNVYADKITLEGNKSIIPGVSIWNYSAYVEIVYFNLS